MKEFPHHLTCKARTDEGIVRFINLCDCHVRRIKELEAQLRGCQALADEKCSQFLIRAEKAEREVMELDYLLREAAIGAEIERDQRENAD